MKRALVLAGGARGAYQVGMLRELVISQGIDFDIIRGVSVGALNAAFLAQAPVAGNSLANLQEKVDELYRLWTMEIRGNNSVYENRVAGEFGLALGADSMYSLKPLRGLLKKHLSLDALRASGRNFAVGTVSLVSGKYEEWTPADRRFIERILASASIPVVFPFVNFAENSKLGEKRDILVDGGVRNITPLKSAFKAQPDEIYVLLTSRMLMEGNVLPESAVPEIPYEQWLDNLAGTRVNGLDVLKRTVDILTDEIYLDDLREARQWNEIAATVNQLKTMAAAPHVADSAFPVAVSKLDGLLAQKRVVKLRLLAPKQWFGKANATTEFLPELIKEAIAHGEAVAKEGWS